MASAEPLLPGSSRQPRSYDPTVQLRSLAATHPYSAAFLLGSSLTAVFIAAVGLTKSALFPGSALTAKQVNEAWSTRYNLLRRQFLDKLEADHKARENVINRIERLENRLEVILAEKAEKAELAGMGDRRVIPSVAFKEPARTMKITIPSPTANSSIHSSSIPNATSSSTPKPEVYKRPVQPYYGLRMGLGKMGPMPVITADNPNYTI